jgi:hypothetical protein
MNRRLLPVMVIVVVISAIAGRYVYRKSQAAAKDASAHKAFLKYSRNLNPFMKRPSGID